MLYITFPAIKQVLLRIIFMKKNIYFHENNLKKA